ncbi:MAG: protein kinase [Anaerolineae bacterium]|nr:protein kinase [Anaerolineae bacterium]
MRVQNPFIYNAPVPPQKFIGRYQEVDQILGSLANPARTSVAISGDPRVGKTSLLHYLRMEEAQEGMGLSPSWCHFIYLDCHTIMPFRETTFWRFILRILGQHFKNHETLYPQIRDLLKQSTPDTYDLSTFFDDVAQSGHLVVLLLDEFEAVTEYLDPEAPQFLYHLRALVNRPDRGLALIVSTRMPLKQLCAGFRFAGSSFDNVFSSITLHPFNETEVDELLDHYHVDFSAQERADLRRLAGHHPYLVQLTGSLMLRARSNRVIEESSTTQIEADLERETEVYFTDILRCSQDQEQMLLTWLALSTFDRQVIPGLSTLLERYEQGIMRLVERGLVCQNIDKVTLFSPIFCRRVLHKNLVTKGHQVLADWNQYLHFLSPPQKEVFRHLVEQINKRPVIIKKPELLGPLTVETPYKPPQNGEVTQKLDRYEVGKLIGKANFADIFQGYDPHLDRPVAIKRLSTTLKENSNEIRARFGLEARAIAVLRHPNILQIYDFDIKRRRPYMVMEFIEGQNLKEHLYDLQATGRTLSWEEVLRISGRVADALDYAHHRNMIHRDVKPANIMLGNDGGVFLSDFGLVRLLDQPGLTQTGRLIGTFEYMAPEQVRGDSHQIDHRADIYALGCLIYEMLTGRPPFTATQLPRAHLEKQPIPLTHFVPHLPKTASHIVLQALAKNPAERPARASQLVHDLSQVLKQNHTTFQLSGSVFLDDIRTEIIRQLYTEGHQPNISRVNINRQFQSGLSGTDVILAQPIDDHGRGLAWEVIKIGPATMLRRENNRYRQYVKGRLPATAVSLERGPVQLRDFGCLSYGFAGDRPFGTVQDLEDYYANHTVQEVIGALTQLMVPLDDRWYGQSSPLHGSFAEEYEAQLPAHLRIEDTIITSYQSFKDPEHRLVTIESILGNDNYANIGERVAIQDLSVTQVMPHRVNLTSAGDGPKIWIRAEIKLPLPDLQEGDRVNIMGTVKARRSDRLAKIAQNVDESFSFFTHQTNGMLTIDGGRLTMPDPLAIYPRFLKKQLDGRKAIIHGDLHPGNILIDDAGRAWLIDFDQVREGHVLYDFIRLETISRLFILGKARQMTLQNKTSTQPIEPNTWPHPFTISEYVDFEMNLLDQTFQSSQQEQQHPELDKATEFILAIRQLAQPYLRTTNNWDEYLVGLFLHNLAQLRFYEEMPQIAILPLTTAAVLGQALT